MHLPPVTVTGVRPAARQAVPDNAGARGSGQSRNQGPPRFVASNSVRNDARQPNTRCITGNVSSIVVTGTTSNSTHGAYGAGGRGARQTGR
jgi:hypothetical protein